MTNDATADYRAAMEEWRERRLARLKAPDGWLNIVARAPLGAGSVSVGNSERVDIALPTGPATLATLLQAADGTVEIAPSDGAPTVRLVPNKKAPPKHQVGQFLLEITTVNGENFLRVRDTKSTVPAGFAGIESFPVRPDRRVVAKWIALDTPEALTIDTSRDVTIDVEATHRAVFDIDGVSYSLLATHGTREAPQFVFRDLTSREETYQACRFVYGEDVTDHTIVIDFNKAINPPCAFTDFAVCPLPPPENVLPIRIEAGEKRVPHEWAA